MNRGEYSLETPARGQICVAINGLAISCSDHWMCPNRKSALMPFDS